MTARYILPNYRIGVVGAGAIGSYYGGKLAYFGRDVHFLMRSDYAAVKKYGLRIRSKGENIRVAKVNAYRSTAEIGPCDVVLIALKATANAEISTLVRPLLQANTILLTLQNGLGNEELLAELFGASRVLGGLCFVCLNRVAPGIVEHYDHGRVALGEFDGYPRPRTHDIAWEFKRCGIVCSVVENLALERWRKLVWNIPFNGLAVAAGGIDVATILADNSLRELVVELMDEVVAIANRCGLALPTAVVLEQVKRTESMGAYKPSTLIDYQAGRPLEVEAIWGEAYRRGQAAGVETPRLKMLYTLLRAINAARTPT